MSEEEILTIAKVDVSNLLDDVIDELLGFADRYHYEVEWVYDEFKKQFNERVKS